MAVINVNTQQLKKSVPLMPKYYGATIREVKPEKSKDGNSINYNIYLNIEDGTDEGRDFKHTVNEAGAANLRQVWEAALSTADDKFSIDITKDFQFDTDDVAGKQVKVKVIQDTWQGNITNKIQGWLPYHFDTDSIPF